MEIEENYEQINLNLKESLNIKNLLLTPLIVMIGLVGSCIGIYSYYKDKDRTIYIYYLIAIIIAILCNLIYILFITYKKQTKLINNLRYKLKTTEINRDALVDELDDKKSKLKIYKKLYWDTKTFFLNAVKTSDNEERNKLLAIYTELTELTERNDIND